MGARSLTVDAPDALRLAPYGVLLGKPCPPHGGPSAFLSLGSDFWQEHVFAPGEGGETEILWVTYRNNEPAVSRLEQHHLTQQAVVPLIGSIVQVLALSGPDGQPDETTLMAVRLSPGEGFCMARNVWHATRSANATCLMLTRRSTTLDLVAGLRDGAAMAETAFAPVAQVTLA